MLIWLTISLAICLAWEIYYSVDSMFYPLEHWLDGAVLEIDEDSPFYLDNSEYDWGHNVKGYKYEEE